MKVVRSGGLSLLWKFYSVSIGGYARQKCYAQGCIAILINI